MSTGDNSSRLHRRPTAAVLVRGDHLRGDVLTALSDASMAVTLEHPGTATEDVLLQVAQLEPDMVFVDVGALSRDPEAGLADLRSRCPDARIALVHEWPDPQWMLASMRSGANEFIFPPIASMAAAAITRWAEECGRKRIGQGRVTGFLSVKGGCGATTIAAHTAVEVRRLTGEPTLMLDLDPCSGCVAFAFNLPTERNLATVATNLERLDPSLWNAIVSQRHGIDVLPAPGAAMMKGQMLDPESVRAVLRFAAGEYRHVVADLGRGVSPCLPHLLHEFDRVYLVTTPDAPAVHQTVAVIRALESARLGKAAMRLVLNRLSKTFTVDAATVAEATGVEVAAELPNEWRAMFESNVERRLVPANTKLGEHFSKLAREMAGVHRNDAEPQSSWRRVFSGSSLRLRIAQR